jgi:hypothetical protein
MLGARMTVASDDGTARPAFERALHESTVIADRIREAIADAPPKLVMLALSDLLQEHLTRLVMVEPDRERTRLIEASQPVMQQQQQVQPKKNDKG